MCGISGFTFKDESKIGDFVTALSHRGPDGKGVFTDDNVSLGHNLLAIVDIPKDSKQPFVSNDGSYALVYNGEIYNYRELRSELEQGGVEFKTQGDTEVLFEGLIAEGVEFLKKVNGMFAFAFYDKARGSLLLARDRMGMKPLYYMEKGGEFYFSSELRVIASESERRLDKEALAVFFELGYVPSPKTLIEGIFKLAPGEYLEWDTKNKLKKLKRFYHPAEDLVSDSISEERLDQIISRSVSDHTMGLRPFGMYLSGGLDSGAVFYELASKGGAVTAFTTRFDTKDSRFNEDADVASRLAQDFNAQYEEVLIKEKDFISAIPKVIAAIEEPQFNPSLPAYYLLAERASRDLTVVLTGEGGDESFMGYDKYYESRKITERFKKLSGFLVNIYYKLKDVLQGNLPYGMFFDLRDPVTRWWYLKRISGFYPRHEMAFKFDRDPRITLRYLSRANSLVVKGCSEDMENCFAALDRLISLPDKSYLMTDKIGMRFGMEARFPFADRRVVEYAAHIPSVKKMKGNETKPLVREAYSGKLPDYVTHKKKTGWTAPALEWMQGELGNMVDEVLSHGYYKETSSLFDFDLLKSKYLHRGSTLKTIFTAFAFQIWAKEFDIKL